MSCCQSWASFRTSVLGMSELHYAQDSCPQGVISWCGKEPPEGSSLTELIKDVAFMMQLLPCVPASATIVLSFPQGQSMGRC